MLTTNELHIIRELTQLLKPFMAATKILCEDNMTASKEIPVIKILKIELETTVTNTEIGKEFKKSLEDQYLSRFKNIENKSILAIAIILDPRFKKMYFSDALACSAAINQIRAMLNREKKYKLKPILIKKCRKFRELR